MKLPMDAHVTDGAGSNHSGDVPSKFCNVFTDATVIAPVPRTKITALAKKQKVINSVKLDQNSNKIINKNEFKR
jgi:hypothetical protein